ncbi:MAG: sugar ABC transporter ATP-binding protein [Planctomycetota bacterium]|nr:sugar ABC transporter ATP-binding protein [Planctomycetota bacterium]
MPADILQFDRVVKRFPGVLALDGVSFSVAAGSVHALVGENGAGKSTLGRILAGVYRPDGGQVLLEGRPLHLSDPRDALRQGIGMVHQELSFCENLSVAENLCLAGLPGRFGFLSRRAMRARAQAMLQAIGITLDPARRIGELSVATQQMVQIAQAVAVGAKVIVFDEPTSSLTAHEAENLFALIGRLRGRGVTMIYVSHRLDEIFRLCDAVTVLRDGRHVVTAPVSAMNQATLIQHMIGRPLEDYYPRHLNSSLGPDVLQVRGLSSPGRFQDVSFSLRAGEVLGLAGLVGAGRSELASAIFGLDAHARGETYVDGSRVWTRSARAAMDLGIGLVPEDRKHQALVPGMSCRANITLAVLERLAAGPFVRFAQERRLAQGFFDRLQVRAPSLETPVMGLSGGNQQKIVLARWLAAKPKVLIVDEPTRGVDVGAKAEIHALIDQLAAQGAGVLLISSELPEVLNLSTRILVMRQGRLVGDLPRSGTTQETLMRLMAGVGAA